MCLLVESPKGVSFSDRFLAGVYMRNSDGVGAFWAEDDQLKYVKELPKTPGDFIAFIREHTEGKDCVWHARMKTHGDINFDNCHPYPVFGFDGEEHEHPMLLAHNGVLFNGNAKDKTKSDTWWFIHDYLRPMLEGKPELLSSPEFVELLGKAIGPTNKFAIMGVDGKPVIINRSAGVTYEGAWLSNTYAWDYRNLHPEASFSSYKYGSYLGKKAQPASKATGKPAQQKQLPLNIPTGGVKSNATSTNTTPHGATGNVVSISKASDVQEMMDAICKKNADVYELITFKQAERVLRDNDFHDPWDMLDMWEMDEINDEDFVAVFKGTKTCTSIVNSVVARWRSDRTPSEARVQ